MDFRSSTFVLWAVLRREAQGDLLVETFVIIPPEFETASLSRSFELLQRLRSRLCNPGWLLSYIIWVYLSLGFHDMLSYGAAHVSGRAGELANEISRRMQGVVGPKLHSIKITQNGCNQRTSCPHTWINIHSFFSACVTVDVEDFLLVSPMIPEEFCLVCNIL